MLLRNFAFNIQINSLDANQLYYMIDKMLKPLKNIKLNQRNFWHGELIINNKERERNLLENLLGESGNDLRRHKPDSSKNVIKDLLRDPREVWREEKMQ